MKMAGIQRRWMFNGIIVIVFIVVAAIAAFSLAIYGYYTSSVRTGLEAKAKTSSSYFTTYVTQTYADYLQSVYKFTEDFEDKDKIELQFINMRGGIEISSYGLGAGTFPGTADIEVALSTGELSTWTGSDPSTGESIMAVSAPLLYSDGSVVGAMRYVTSMSQVYSHVLRISLIACAIGLAIILIVVLSNLYFLHTITEPIRTLTVVAKRIAEGSYGVQAEKKYDDEIGILTDTINEMSTKIGQAEKVQTEFISSVSHELRTPLTAITGWSETLMFDEDLNEDSRRGLAIISREAGRLTKMVEELLEFTRIQDGRFSINVEQIDISEELEDTIFSYAQLLWQESVELNYTPSDEPLPLISGDQERLKQVFLNIIDNAAKHGKEGKKIDVSIRREGGSVVIRTRDYGHGIPEKDLPHVKRKFYKGSSKERGNGIGLAVCDEIVTRHKGELIIENADGGGAVVTVKLPIQATALPKEK